MKALGDREMRQWQADHHELMHIGGSGSVEEDVLRLIHVKAYEVVSAIAEGARVLDVGCNIGHGTSVLGTTAREAIGIDVSEKALGEASARSGGVRASFVLAEGKALPFPGGRFDLVVAFQLVEHLSSYGEFFGEIKRVVDSAGLLVFTTPNKTIRLDEGMPPWNPMHNREFNASELGLLLGEYFPYVKLLGLRGNEGIRSVELARLASARRKARRTERRVRRSAYAVMDLFLPAFHRRRFRELIRRTIHRGRRPTRVERYASRDLFYSEQDLESSLDLLAVCRLRAEAPLELLRAIQASRQDAL